MGRPSRHRRRRRGSYRHHHQGKKLSALASVRRVISAAELSSIETAVGELGTRVAQAADELMGTPNEDVGVELYEVERSLRMARRRLAQATEALR